MTDHIGTLKNHKFRDIVGLAWTRFHGGRVVVWPSQEQPKIDELASLVTDEARSRSQLIGHEARRREWLAARALSSYLTGFEPGETAVGFPIWPNNWLGSISHKSGHVAIWASQSPLMRCGVDLEQCREFELGFLEKIMDQNEVRLAESAVTRGFGSMVFAAKEAIYKALCPLVGRKFYFDAVFLADISGAGDYFDLNFVVSHDLSELIRRNDSIRVSAKIISIAEIDYWLALAFFPNLKPSLEL